MRQLTWLSLPLWLGLQGCGPDALCFENRSDHAALLVWSTPEEGVEVPAGEARTWRLTDEPGVPPMEARGSFFLTSLTSARAAKWTEDSLDFATVDCETGEIYETFSREVDLNQPFDIECGGTEACEIEICVRVDNQSAIPIRLEMGVNVALFQWVDCDEEARTEREAPLAALDAELLD